MVLHPLVVRELGRADVASEDEVILRDAWDAGARTALLLMGSQLGFRQELPGNENKDDKLDSLAAHLPQPLPQVLALSEWMF